MSDVPVGAVPAPEAAAFNPAAAKADAAKASKAAKLATLNKGLAEVAAKSAEPAKDEPKLDGAPPDEGKLETAAAEATADDVAKIDADRPEAVEEPPDAKTSKALAAIDKREKRFREEQARVKSELELERAEIARLRAEQSGKLASFDDLKKLKPLDVLSKLGYTSEDDYETIARQAYALSKSGKADPRSKQVAEQTTREREMQARLDAYDEKFKALESEFTKRDEAARGQQVVARFQDDAVKAIPTTPSLIGKLHEKAPAKARQALLDTAVRLEKESGDTPSPAETIAAYEKARREELEEQGVDVEAMLRSAPVPAEKRAAPSKTLDVGSPASGIRPTTTNLSKTERLAAITAGLRKLESQT